MNKNLLRLRGQKTQKNEGFTLIELLVIISLIGIVAAFSAPYITFGINPLRDTTNRVASIFKLMRIKAMSQTSVYRIKQTDSTTLKIERGRKSCDSNDLKDWSVDNSFDSEYLTLTEAKDIQGLSKNTVIKIIVVTENGSPITPLIEEIDATGKTVSPGWSLCFNSRGLADKTVKLTLEVEKTTEKKRIEIFQGGGVQIYEE